MDKSHSLMNRQLISNKYRLIEVLVDTLVIPEQKNTASLFSIIGANGGISTKGLSVGTLVALTSVACCVDSGLGSPFFR